MNDLKKALHFFLYDKYDLDDLTQESSDEEFIETLYYIHANYIAYNKNREAKICPYITYGLESNCPFLDKCKKYINDGTNHINCFIDGEKVYEAFYKNEVIMLKN